MLTPIDLKRDYADRSLLDPSRWNADQLALMTAINKLISSAADGDSGADSVAMTPIAELGDGNRVQVVMEALVAALKSTTAGGGAAFVKSQGIAGLTGETVYALLVALKDALDTHKGSHDHDGIYLTETETTALLDALAAALNAHKGSSDHDNRYLQPGNNNPYTPTGDYNPVHKLWALQQIAAAVLGGIPDDSITDQKMAVGNKKQDIIDAVVPLIPDATFDFDNVVGKSGWNYTSSEVGAVLTETYTLDGVTKATRVSTLNTPTAGKTTEVTTGPTGKVTSVVYDDTTYEMDITEV